MSKEYIVCGVGKVREDELAPWGKVTQLVLEMRRRCLTVKQIAKRLHRRDRYVSYVLNKTGEWGRGVSEVKQLRSRGYSIKAIARKLKISDKTVSKVVRTHCKGNKRTVKK